jgi:uncharacterized HhH-GPD family protein
MTTAATFPVTGDEKVDGLLVRNPLALLIGMLLDQQVPIEWAFRAPYGLQERLGRDLDAKAIASMDVDDLKAVFAQKPTLHRYHGSMAERVHKLCVHIVDQYGGDAERIWADSKTGEELFGNVRALPGFGEQKAQIFTALLAKRMGVAPPGWQEHAGHYGEQGYFSAADIDAPGALAKVREYKRAMKATAKKA